MREDFTVAEATAADWDEIVAWTEREGWNPGLGDAACFRPTDPAGFLVGRIDGRIVSAVSLVAYSPDYAFLGYYLVHPDHRGTGLGMATWNAALPHAKGRVIGLDAVPAQRGLYIRSGFTAAYDNVRYTGRPSPAAAAPGAGTVGSVTPYHLDAISAYDSGCFPAERHAFLSRWLTADGHTARVLLDGSGHVTGYGVIRPAHQGLRVGPLFADTHDGAAALFDALVTGLPAGAEVSIDVPDHHPTAAALAESRGLTESSRCTRMYSAPAPYTRTDAVFGTTTLELG
ncbi:GNAT family N-acetyltransferase [Streptomyces sp. NPDC049040]|uniref:GNAT family N-acetyltransferase n=1 Tax=Streptomyces sp. NPDC049040 TaxID=3365593 RepID=UPI003722DC45